MNKASNSAQGQGSALLQAAFARAGPKANSHVLQLL
jgi:hypothetical protein